MATRVDVDGRIEDFDAKCLEYPPFNPILFPTENGCILQTEMVAIFPSVLEHGRFIVAKSIGRGGEMLLETSANCSLGLTDIRAWA